MHHNYQTQCPHCHTIYPLPEAIHNQPEARANCGNCHQIFTPHQHLIVPDAVAPVSTNSAQAHTAHTDTAPNFDDSQIFDDMPIDAPSAADVPSFSADELNRFLDSQTAAAAPTDFRKTEEDESWLDELLKSDGNPAVKIPPVKAHANDDLSDIIGADLDSIIPAAPAPHEDYKKVLKKVRERIESHPPTQEQLVTKRSFASQLAWALGCVAMAALLGVQYVLFNIDNIIKNPQQAELLKSACTVITCNLPTANSDGFSSTYQLKSGRADYTTDLLITLKNTAGVDQLHPNLKISVYGDNRLLGDLVATPADYLVSQQRLITPTQDRQLMLSLVDITQDEIRSVSIEPFY